MRQLILAGEENTDSVVICILILLLISYFNSEFLKKKVGGKEYIAVNYKIKN